MQYFYKQHSLFLATKEEFYLPWAQKESHWISYYLFISELLHLVLKTFQVHWRRWWGRHSSKEKPSISAEFKHCHFFQKKYFLNEEIHRKGVTEVQETFLGSEFEQLLWKKCGTKHPAISTARILRTWEMVRRQRSLEERRNGSVQSSERKGKGTKGRSYCCLQIPNARM